jgi:16S rRNA processing protein RimM
MPREQRNDAGSHQSREPAFLILGKLRRAHGVLGEIPMEIYTQLLDLFAPDHIIYIGEGYQPFTIESTRWKQDLLLFKFKEVNDRTAASALTNQFAFIRSDQLPELAEGEYYNHQLVGLKVFEDEGAYLGVLEQVLMTGANDVYLVRAEDGGEILIPAIDNMIQSIDLGSEKMIVGKMEWYGEGD